MYTVSQILPHLNLLSYLKFHVRICLLSWFIYLKYQMREFLLSQTHLLNLPFIPSYPDRRPHPPSHLRILWLIHSCTYYFPILFSYNIVLLSMKDKIQLKFGPLEEQRYNQERRWRFKCLTFATIMKSAEFTRHLNIQEQERYKNQELLQRYRLTSMNLCIMKWTKLIWRLWDSRWNWIDAISTTLRRSA